MVRDNGMVMMFYFEYIFRMKRYGYEIRIKINFIYNCEKEDYSVETK